MCTGIKLTAQDNAVIYGRTLEFGQDLQSQIITIPRNYPLQGWQSRYAAVGANACDMPCILDGINEQGLAGGLFYFPGFAEFQEVTNPKALAIAPWDLMTWILTTCASVDQVKQTLPTICVTKTVFKPWGIIPPVHAIVHDKHGKSLVIEYRAGKLFMYDNPLGIFTNSPDFEWHLTNLRNYINVSTYNANTLKLGPLSLAPLGQGSGMVGLPGDFTPPSRFVRAAIFSQNIMGTATAEDARRAAFHILDLFNIPKGIVREKQDTPMHTDYTQWTSVCDLRNNRYYYHTYANRTPIMIDLMQENGDAKDVVTKKM